MAISKHQSGITLVELMIAVTLSIVITAGVIQIFISNKRTYEVQEAVSRLQENGRFASEFIADDIRMVGFMGCNGKSGGVTVTNNVDLSKRNHGADIGYDADVDTVLTGYAGADSLQAYYYDGTLTADLTNMGFSNDGSTGSLVANTVILKIIRGGSCPGADVTEFGMTGATANVKIADNSVCQVKQNDIVMVSNCTTADIFGVSSSPVTSPGSAATLAHGSNWNFAPIFAESYTNDASLYKVLAYFYYIGVGESGQPALFRRRLGTLATNNGSFVKDELVEGIDTITYLFGVDTDSPEDGIPDIYVNAQTMATTYSTKWDQVVAVRYTIVARTLNDNLASGVDADYNDKRIRREFTNTITIRNRAAG